MINLPFFTLRNTFYNRKEFRLLPGPRKYLRLALERRGNKQQLHLSIIINPTMKNSVAPKIIVAVVIVIVLIFFLSGGKKWVKDGINEGFNDGRETRERVK